VTSINDMLEPHRSTLAALPDDSLLRSLADLEPLPDESDPDWLGADSNAWRRTGEFLAHADEVAKRRLIAGVGLVLEKACFGDPGETMRGLRHSLEQAVDGDWVELASICTSALASHRPGTRLWAIHELAVLREPSSVDAIRMALDDGEAAVRIEACRAVEMLAQRHPNRAAALRPDVLRLGAGDEDMAVRRQADRAAATLRLADPGQ
jgi:hypothetical protein